tara:strand:+ start:7461 stop:7727 length:267 start_codon:yes stop_codon:yes gene_type:complete
MIIIDGIVLVKDMVESYDIEKDWPDPGDTFLMITLKIDVKPLKDSETYQIEPSGKTRYLRLSSNENPNFKQDLDRFLEFMSETKPKEA